MKTVLKCFESSFMNSRWYHLKGKNLKIKLPQGCFPGSPFFNLNLKMLNIHMTKPFKVIWDWIGWNPKSQVLFIITIIVALEEHVPV